MVEQGRKEHTPSDEAFDGVLSCEGPSVEQAVVRERPVTDLPAPRERTPDGLGRELGAPEGGEDPLAGERIEELGGIAEEKGAWGSEPGTARGEGAGDLHPAALLPGIHPPGDAGEPFERTI